MPFKYTTVPGYFWQDDHKIDPRSFDYIASEFGLVKDHDGKAARLTQWQRFAREIEVMRNGTASNGHYKLLFLGRHGEGVHNVAEKRYGTQAWDAEWAKLNGDDRGDWVDAMLTQTGRAQARRANALWRAQIEEGIPLPQSYYTSPLIRCLETALLTFEDLPLPDDRPFIAKVKELLRETMGVHTCDSRSSKSKIIELFKGPFDQGKFVFEDGFVEDDMLYRPDHRETNDEIDARLKTLLDDIFAHDESQFISLTSHSGTIASILRVVGHQQFALQTGAVIPVLVRAEEVCSHAG